MRKRSGFIFRRMILTAALTAVLLLLMSCARSQESQLSLAQSIELDENAAAEVEFETVRENGREYGQITGISDSGQTVWTRKTHSYASTQTDRVADIGIRGNLYYYVEGGDIVALSRQDGSRVWKNMEFGGCPAKGAFAFDDDNRLFITGYLGPQLFAVDMNGLTVARQVQLGEGYRHPVSIALEGSKAVVTFEEGPGSSAGEQVQGTLYVDIDSMTASEREEGEREIYVVNVSSSLKLRTGPSLSSATLTGLRSGTRLYMIRMEGEWAYVEVEESGQTGYVYAQYIKPAQ
ncbi:MAG: SH3 domain-containing protein [Lachnospiraceae bacterium]|nr:SH3 domain-containing protein [Lachnospiraceae bacterium]MBQ4304180.1 SH3 domain-containing protein [Lachnospiraceae bacterium]MBQ5360198.1 SH3 domain-containing protein [Lachnospiraceae bacterium]